jgi:branched-chain amino acid aminotransferase
MFDDLIAVNDSYLKESEFTIGLKNRAFNYGDAIFETMRSNGQNVHFFEAHYSRITKGAQILGMAWPEKFNAGFLESVIKGLLHRKRLYQGARVKLSLIRNEGGLFIPETNAATILVQASYLDQGEYQLNPKGLIVDLFESYEKPVEPWSGFKTANALPYILAGNYASSRNLNDVVLLAKGGKLCEATSSNVFIYKDKQLLTPPVSSGCVNGIMRNATLSISKKLGIEVLEKDLMACDLEQATEVFLTNSIRGIQWIGAYKTTRFTNKISKKLIMELNKVTQV